MVYRGHREKGWQIYWCHRAILVVVHSACLLAALIYCTLGWRLATGTSDCSKNCYKFSNKWQLLMLRSCLCICLSACDVFWGAVSRTHKMSCGCSISRRINPWQSLFYIRLLIDLFLYITNHESCYRLDGPGIESRWGRHFPPPSRLAVAPT